MSLRDFLSRRIGLWLIVTGVVALLLAWDWNWFRPLVATALSQALQRPVTLGHFDLDAGRVTMIRLDQLVVANPIGFAEEAPPALVVEQLLAAVDVRALFDRQVRVVSLMIDRPTAAIQQTTDGRSNLPLPPPGQASAEPNLWRVEVEKLAIHTGRFRWQDAARGADIHGTIATQAAGEGEEDRLVAEAQGRIHQRPFEAHFTGGSILTLRDVHQPYPVNLQAQSGDTHLSLEGTLLDPLRLAGAQLALAVRGANLADLYPLVPIAFPVTPAYVLQGALALSQGAVLFQHFTGTVGASDLRGSVVFTPGRPRHRLDATLRSDRVVLSDLAGFIGGTPGATGQAGDTPALAAARARQAARGRLLPSKPIDVPRLRLADVHLHYVGRHIEGDRQPLDDLEARLDIVDGNIRVAPLAFGVGRGRLEITAAVDSSGAEPRLDLSAHLRRLDVSQLLASLGKAYRGDGQLGGRVTLQTHGRSVADWLGRGDGRAQLFMSGGDFSAVLLDLAGIDLGNAVVSALGIPSRTRIHCLVADLPLQQGQLKADTVLLDTDRANLKLDGQVNFADETLDLRAFTEPKRASIGRLRAPINIRGTLRDPTVLPDLPQLGLRAGAAVALGTLFTPLAALLPTLQLGLGSDADCQALIDRTRRTAAVKNANAAR